MSDVDTGERRKPGRPSNADLAARAAAIGAAPSEALQTAGAIMAEAKAEIEQVTGGGRSARAEDVANRRRRRQGMGAERNLKLHVPEESKDPNFVYRWVNDRAGRVRQLTRMDDYEVVSSSELNGGDPDPMGNTAEGTVMKRTADRGIGEATVLLKKPKEYYLADKKEEAQVLDERDKMLRKGPPAAEAAQGLSNADNAYVPGGRNVIGGK